MSTKRKTTDAAEVTNDQSTSTVNPSPAPTAQQPETQAPADSQGTGERKSTWASHFGSFTDNQAGVRLIEDRENRLMTIKFSEKPSEAVRTLLKSEPYGFRFDPDDKVWYKRISQAKPAQSRREAQDLAFEVANLIRQEKGLEQKTPNTPDL